MAETPTQWLRRIHQIAATAEDQKQFIAAVRGLCHEILLQLIGDTKMKQNFSEENSNPIFHLRSKQEPKSDVLQRTEIIITL
jgi:hypothetical protein